MPELTLDDDATKVFFNTDGTNDSAGLSENAKAFLRFVGGKATENDFVKRVQDRIKQVKKNEEWRREYMTLLLRDKENQEIGRQEGLKEGRKEGRQEGILETSTKTAINLLKLGCMSVESIAGAVGLPVSTIKQLKFDQNL